MPAYSEEPVHHHEPQARTAIILVNLGTPEAPTAAAVRRFLRQFLSDRRVVELPRILWWPILHSVVLAVRPGKSAAKYARIWMPEGSPLKVHTQRQTALLAKYLQAQLPAPPAVRYAMRYGEPSISKVLAALKADGFERILVLPLYPQYAASVTATTMDEICRYLQGTRNIPEIRMVKHFHDHPSYIVALSNQIRDYWHTMGRPDRLLMSFHGLPRHTVDRGDPYHFECLKTAGLLAERLELRNGTWQIAFQSRFGAARWLQPYTAASLRELGKGGVRRVDVVCPGFVADCLETLEEIGVEGKQTFLAAGGSEFHLLPCLNERDDWISGIAAIALEHTQGWIGQAVSGAIPKNTAAAGRGRAPAIGAAQ